MLRLALAVAVVVAALAAVLSSPGRAVLDEVREAVGVERAQPALFSLPAPGRLLVASDAGVWVVQEDGSKRLLGPYREASWSPFGRFVVAARENELAALEPTATCAGRSHGAAFASRAGRDRRRTRGSRTSIARGSASWPETARRPAAGVGVPRPDRLAARHRLRARVRRPPRRVVVIDAETRRGPLARPDATDV